MATVLLSAAGAAIGGSIGGSVLGLSAVAAGRFVGATLGRVIDQRLMGQGAEAVETGRVERFRLTGVGEGDPIARLYGRMRVAGQVIWASEFRETAETSGGGGGKGGRPASPKVTRYSYSVSLAVALCEGEISGVGRIWADGAEVAPADLGMHVYTGSADQLPDPKMEAVEGAGKVPAYRGTAYVVFEDLELEQFGNRVPQFTFEVIRPAPLSLPEAEEEVAHAVRAVALMPGSGEYALATRHVTYDYGAGNVGQANLNSASGQSDLATALDQLDDSLTGCEAVSLIVSWFGDDLRCGDCTIRPKVEQRKFDGKQMPWRVAGLTRGTAELVVRDEADELLYGGTPADASVIESIQALQARGKAVMFYPFILMDQVAGNSLPDPYGDEEGQAHLPWRGRITGSQGPGRPGSPDGTALAAQEVADFFGTASASDFSTWGGHVSYSGPNEWGFRRFILHCAALCAAAGGVDSFCIGSEMVGLTQLRGADNTFPAVAELRALAAEVRAILGPEVKIGYAADWSEYFGYQPQDGTGDRFFHLDPLWSDPEIDFIGIDNYLPLSDWREGDAHLDAADHATIYDPAYLAGNIEGGELYDWYYHSPEARAAQIRTPITDGAHGEPWVWRVKDLRNWWLNDHHERIDGVRQEVPTDWVPQSKPIWFTELGCAAVDKGTNQPNKFLDPKSSESAVPYYSTGARDELIQQQYLRVMLDYWTDPSHNPLSVEYGGPMLDMTRAFVWAWDARPYPVFPNNRELWSDGGNHAAGHWITGRASSRSLASVVSEICEAAGLQHYDVSGLYGVVSGYLDDELRTPRAALQPLMLRYGFDAVERDGVIRFIMRDGRVDARVEPEELAVSPELEGTLERQRAPEAEMAGRVRLRFVEAGGEFEAITEEAILPDDDSRSVAGSEIPLAMSRGEGRQVVERWLAEARVARDTLRFALPPSRREIGAGDVVEVAEETGHALYRIDRAEHGVLSQVEAVRIAAEIYEPGALVETVPRVTPYTPPLPVLPLWLDLPLMRGDEVPHAPHIAVTAEPWPGAAAVYASASDAGYQLDRVLEARATIGVTTTDLARGPAGRVDRGAPLGVTLTSGALASVVEEALLSGANLMAIGDGQPGNWELFQFRDAVLTGERSYLLSHRLRGQLGSEALMPEVWPEGSWVVLLNGVPEQITLAPSQRRLARHYRIGPAQRGPDDPSYLHEVLAFDGIGLKPYAPCHLRATPAGGGDIAFSWMRRTRIEGDSWDLAEVPLGEESLSFLLRIRQGGAVIREETVEATGWTYSAAAQSADGLSGLAELEVAQVSASFGPGAGARLAFQA
ncbi:glycoside hydrolase/phage tail family protein [Pseudooceanicola marinus]|uniref:baseplate multidomain protein megatron n=1 Tax=Pseudooceanicola marinus TaxID=396013 RepID=UPI001CD75C60|nr:glycoside hydrolase/phage tail family protein [Pseudooceanicola marinus]MCA1334747.1 glycoside hydrolase/phage tail family protein [Pseudooceanicola marinus]